MIEIFEIEIFDLDGTLWMPASTPLCVSAERLTHPRWAAHPRDYRLIADMAETIALLHQQGSRILICTNQGGLPWNVHQGRRSAREGKPFRPYKTWTHFLQEQTYLSELLPQISEVWCSPGLETGIVLRGRATHWRMELLPGIECHKPAPTMLLEIWRNYPAASYRFWGDRPTDEQCAIAAQRVGMPVTFQWVLP